MSDYIKRIRTLDGDKQIDYESLANLPIIDRELNSESNNAIANSAVFAEIGDINTALEEIIAIQENLMTPDGNGVKY